MIAQIQINSSEAIQVNLSKPIDISIPIKEGSANPNCYWADQVKFETIRAEGFIGSVKEGGAVNYQKLIMTPHGNGTHVECYGHITDSGATIANQLTNAHFYAKLISLTPEKAVNGDSVIKLNEHIKTMSLEGIKALIIRTLPNGNKKLTRSYSGTNPPYISADLVHHIVSAGIEHILVDLPSIDKEVDNGKLRAHKAFWSLSGNTRKKSTITELIYVPDSIPDANYLLNLQSINLQMDAAPCKPTLYSVEKIMPFQT